MHFLVLILLILDKVNAIDIGNCTQKGKKECCINFILKEEKCVACPPGTYGINCTATCPSNLSGDRCRGICNCSEDQICDYRDGCGTPEYFKDLYDDCTGGMRTTKCCMNQRVKGNDCQDCWNGTYGTDCVHKCSKNRYGRFCLNRCNCTGNETCHYANGCNIDMREGDLGREYDGSLGREDDGSLWIKIPGISLGVIVILLIASCILIRIKMRQERKWGRFVQGNPLSSNLHAGASVTTLLSTASSRNEDKPKVTVSEYPTLKISQDRDKCFDSYNTIMRDESDFQQNRRSIPIFFTSNTDRNKMKSSTLPDSRLHSNIHRSSRDNAKRDKKQEKHTKKGLRSFENDIDQRVLHTVESAEDFSFQKHMTVRSQDTRSQDTNPVRYSLVQNVISRPQDPESKSKQSAVRYSLVKNVSENFSLNN